MSDPRFSRLKSDPRFRRPKKHKSKIVVDDRFKSIFEHEGRSTKKRNGSGRVDKYGRPLSDTHEKDNLKRFYRLENETDAEPSTLGPDYARGEVLMESSDEESAKNVQSDSEADDGGVVILGNNQSKPIHITLDNDSAEVDLDENNFADLDAQAAAYSQTVNEDEDGQGEAEHTRRLAVINLDWDHVRAIHLYKIFSSVISATSSNSKKGTLSSRGKVLSVRVYPSQFGKEKMEREEREGPPVELFKKQTENEEDINAQTIYETGDADEYDEDALRRYQLERLRYFYAVVECDTVQTASYIFSELQGAELERSANVFDLSFVPDDMSFDEECRDEATIEDLNTEYKPFEFVTDALRHSKVKLTWDQDDPERDRITRRALSKKEIEENDFRAYIASTSGSESDVSQQKDKKAVERERLRKLLLGDQDKLPEGWTGAVNDGEKGDVDMEVMFMPALSSARDGEETTLEKYQRKMREKRKKRKEERKEREEEREKKGELGGDDFFGDSGSESGADDEPDEPARKNKHKGKKGKKSTEMTVDERKPSTKEELALLVSADNPDAEPKHFDMKAVLRAEKRKGKKSRKGKRSKVSDNGDNEAQENFQIDVKDERFRALHEDYHFAIDPSNPHFKKTKSMSALLEERARRQHQEREDKVSESKMSQEKAGGQSLQRLVDSVKRKSVNPNQGSGKRQKT